ncbi:MAG: type II toxin-antitoxin system VapC family toxin [Chloroflexi bacterium]|nr:type II toxin-antitoxin system VapC family toxin [Chloroflexota bacterium]
MDRVTELRANYGFKTPDAIHLACAIIAKCDLFLTNDRQLKKQSEIAIELVGVSK